MAASYSTVWNNRRWCHRGAIIQRITNRITNRINVSDYETVDRRRPIRGGYHHSPTHHQATQCHQQ